MYSTFGPGITEKYLIPYNEKIWKLDPIKIGPKVEFHNIKYGYVVNDLDYEKNIKIIRDYLENIGIRIVGRFSEWEYHNMDARIRSSMNFVSRWKNGDYIK